MARQARAKMLTWAGAGKVGAKHAGFTVALPASRGFDRKHGPSSVLCGRTGTLSAMGMEVVQPR